MDARRLITSVSIALGIALTPLAASNAASGCVQGVEAVGSAILAQGTCTDGPATVSGNSGAGTNSATYDPNRPRYEYRAPCGAVLNTGATGAGACAANTCPPGETNYQLWQVAPGPAFPVGLVCVGPGEPVQAAAPPQVTEAMVLEAFRRIPLPELRSVSQPADKTLINFDTIFFTDAEPLTRTVTLLGQQVRLEIEPSRFEWTHGDGTSAVTRTAGAAYPSKTIVHRYADAHTTVEHHVTVTWTARWSLNGGPLQPVAGTVTTVGPPTPLRVAEASPALSGYGH